MRYSDTDMTHMHRSVPQRWLSQWLWLTCMLWWMIPCITQTRSVSHVQVPATKMGAHMTRIVTHGTVRDCRQFLSICCTDILVQQYKQTVNCEECCCRCCSQILSIPGLDISRMSTRQRRELQLDDSVQVMEVSKVLSIKRLKEFQQTFNIFCHVRHATFQVRTQCIWWFVFPHKAWHVWIVQDFSFEA